MTRWMSPSSSSAHTGTDRYRLAYCGTTRGRDASISMSREFVPPQSIVRTIWSQPDLILLIFAGAAAEFALNRAVDWLFFTGKIPRDPIGRLFSTVQHARGIVFASDADARATLSAIMAAHAAVERRRRERIPDWAHRDVLYMLIDYSKRAYELVHRPLNAAELADLHAAFLRLGEGLRIPELPGTPSEWLEDRQRHLARDLAYSTYTARLFERYRAELGPWRYRILLEVQALLLPAEVRKLLRLSPKRMIGSAVHLYSLCASAGLRPLVLRALIPPKYWGEVEKLQ
jgi:hypothetical protein